MRALEPNTWIVSPIRTAELVGGEPVDDDLATARMRPVLRRGPPWLVVVSNPMTYDRSRSAVDVEMTPVV